MTDMRILPRRLNTLKIAPLEAAFLLANANPGAMKVCIEILKKTPEIDPDCFLEGMNYLFAFDDLEIYEEKIWVLYKDICQQNVVYLLALLRHKQFDLGTTNAKIKNILSKSLRYEIADHNLNFPEILAAVQKQLPDFGKTQC